MKLQHRNLTEFIAAIYRAYGVSDQEADIVARSQVEANLVGHDSHGVIKTADYPGRIVKGNIVPGASFEIESETPTTAVVNGNWGFGFVITEQAMDLAVGKADQHGVAAVTVHHQGHIGRLGAYTARAAEHCLIAIMTSDSGLGPKSVAPYGGREARLGTNRVFIAVPSCQDSAACIDMATASVASGKLQVARSRGDSVPLGWILDRNGNPSDDPNAYYEGGALLPLGADQGHKGFGLSFMVEVLSGLLTGLGLRIDPNGRHNDGCFIALFDVERFRPLGVFRADVEPAVGFTEVLYPGELEHRRRVALAAVGIDVDDRTGAQLVDFASNKGVDIPVGVAA
jgi:LDH2 family malate/lactate/ureidoglycolate dehydrogenase